MVAKLKHEQHQPPAKRAKPATTVDKILAKLEKQCDAEAAIVYDHTDLEQALQALFAPLALLRPAERTERLARMLAALPEREREVARVLGETLAVAVQVSA